VNTTVGWAVGRFGFPGVVEPAVSLNPWLNYAGVVCVMVGGVFFARVKPTVDKDRSDATTPIEANSLTIKRKIM